MKSILSYLRRPTRDGLARSLASFTSKASNGETDVCIVGAGHNGLAAAVLLAGQGLKVSVLEEKAMVGGACRTEYPFSKVPGLGHSTGAYLLGVMPPELFKVLGLEGRVQTLRRDPHYFLPTLDGRYLMMGSDEEATNAQFDRFFSPQDRKASASMNAELALIREDIAPAWLKEPGSIEDTAEQYIRPSLREVFVNLCRQPVSHYLDRFHFKSDLLRAMYAVTDGFSGLNGTWSTPGTGMNFLAHQMCRLSGSDGTWMVVKGGMGSVTQQLAAKAIENGADVRTDSPVAKVLLGDDGTAVGVQLTSGEEVRSRTVLVNADPFRLQELAGPANFPDTFNTWVQSLRRDGTTMKVNMALKDLPTFSCLPERRGQHHTTIHLLPPEENVIHELERAFDQVQAGQLPDWPTIEWYIHTPVDPSLQDAEGHHSSALFVQWVPYELQGTTWEAEEEGYVNHLLSIADKFAPGTSDLVADTFTLTPPKIEQHFGITRGHIHHVDNSYGFNERYPYATPVPGLYCCSAGTHPAGSVIGAAGHNAAARLVKDLGLTPSWPTA